MASDKDTKAAGVWGWKPEQGAADEPASTQADTAERGTQEEGFVTTRYRDDPASREFFFTQQRTATLRPGGDEPDGSPSPGHHAETIEEYRRRQRRG